MCFFSGIQSWPCIGDGICIQNILIKHVDRQARCGYLWIFHQQNVGLYSGCFNSCPIYGGFYDMDILAAVRGSCSIVGVLQRSENDWFFAWLCMAGGVETIRNFLKKKLSHIKMEPIHLSLWKITIFFMGTWDIIGI